MNRETDSEPVTVDGQVLITPTVPPFCGATLHVYLEDTGAIDAPAVVLAEVRSAPFDHPANGAKHQPTILPFSIQLTSRQRMAHAAGRLSVRVWVDTHSGGQVDVRDLFSDQAYPVLTHGFGNRVVIRLV